VSQANPRPSTQLSADPAGTETYLLAEGPLWDAAAGRVLWVDIRAAQVIEGRLTGDGLVAARTHQLSGTVGAVVPASDGSLLVAAADCFAVVGADGGVTYSPRLLPEGLDSRFNDGAVDPAGRFLAGAMAEDDRRGEERLYRFDAGAAVSVVDEGLTLSNGLAWSPDGGTMYQVDSVPGVVWRRSYDAATGAMGPREEWLTSFEGGVPDGLCTDAAGNVWIAVHGAGEVRAFAPDGEWFATVTVDAPHTTKPGFVGPELDRLMITTARDELSPEQRERYPASGQLFLADVGAELGLRGLPAPPWAGTAPVFAAAVAEARDA
jgi:sugar lactone lactonase YvrE